jgi:hypothetical protein
VETVQPVTLIQPAVSPPTVDDAEIERACRELTGAILLVSGGRFPAVVITNLEHCWEAIRMTLQLADESGVDLVPIARPDGSGCDVSVRAR